MPRVSISRTKYVADDFIKWIKIQMVKKNLTQADLADKLGISQQSLSYRMIHNTFTVKELIKIFEIFNTNADEAGKLLTTRK